MLVDIARLPVGSKGIVTGIKGGYGCMHRLESMGIRVGKTIQKVSGQSGWGPQIIKIDNLQIAIGCGMAKHILVEMQQP